MGEGWIQLVRAKAARLHVVDLFTAMQKYRRRSPRGMTLREAELLAAHERTARVWMSRLMAAKAAPVWFRAVDRFN